jgi:hypothetical protein
MGRGRARPHRPFSASNPLKTPFIATRDDYTHKKGY